MAIKQFVIRFLCATLSVLALIGLFNYIVDPFWYYRDIEIKGFNAVKLKFRDVERHVKPPLLIREQPEAIILGSSFAEIGFDPNNKFFTDHGRLKGMNFALAGAPWEMVQCHFEFAAAHARIKRALIGFHPDNMPLADCEKDFASIGQVNIGEFLLSMSTLRASIKTIRKQDTQKPSHTRDGRFFFVRDDSGVNIRFGEDFMRRKKQRPRCVKASDMLFNSGAGNALDLNGLRRMIKTAKEHHIELVLVAYPQHAYSLELDNQCGDQDDHWRAMQQIASLIEAEAEPYQVHAWHFYNYNDITTEPIGTTAKYWQDSMHFNFEMGDVMLADIFGENPDGPKFGRPIATNRIKTDFRDYLRNRSDYLQHHPEFQGNLQQLQHICSGPANKCRP
ncbi:MAG: hypothetical protein PHG00_05050 [Methylococcales bacterium]|nr:hypothetical protein [Methylococcales bacterium]